MAAPARITRSEWFRRRSTRSIRRSVVVSGIRLAYGPTHAAYGPTHAAYGRTHHPPSAMSQIPVLTGTHRPVLTGLR
jgi:hypothetical protein